MNFCRIKQPDGSIVTIPFGAGAMGEKSEKGDSPFIGGNGNWWVGDMDTGVTASGGADGLVTQRDENGVNRLYLTQKGKIISEGVVLPQGGGGGGGSTGGAVLTMTNTTGWMTKTIAQNA
jgi:hypothetical protein